MNIESNSRSGIKNNFGVIFDLDGVIVDSNPTHTIALRRFCAQHGHHLSDEELKAKIYGRANKDWLPDIFGDRMTAAEYKQLADEKEALFRQLFAPIIRPLTGLLAFLDQLAQQQIPRAVASSAPPENVEFVLEKTGTKKYFEIILTENSIRKGKPDPEIYLKTARLLQLPPGQCVVFEDAWSGIRAARAAGCKVVGVTTTHTKEEFAAETDLVVAHFQEIDPTHLAALF
jgi:HAD superfamily hydrolase (TIGR01509 family)